METRNLIGGTIGTIMSATGTALSTNEILETISLILTILGALITLIIIPMVSWYHNAKRDGRITPNEIKDGLDTLQDGIEKVKDKIDDRDNKGSSK